MMRQAPPLQVATGGYVADGHADATALITALVAETNEEWRRRGVAGARVVFAFFDERDGWASLTSAPGPEPLTVGDVRAFVAESTARQRETGPLFRQKGRS